MTRAGRRCAGPPLGGQAEVGTGLLGVPGPSAGLSGFPSLMDYHVDVYYVNAKGKFVWQPFIAPEVSFKIVTFHSIG